MRQKRQREKIIIVLCTLLLLMTVGYAAFETQFSIKGKGKVTSNWDIRITNVTETNKLGSGESTNPPTWDNLTANMEADLYKKGDSVEYEVTIENKGTLDAKLEDIISNVKSNNEAIKISFSGYIKGEKLFKNTEKKLKVKIEYNPEFTGKAEGSGEVEISFDYVQAEGGTITPSTDTYLLTYDYKTNGGTDTAVYDEYLKEGSQINLSYSPKKEGYEFIGWNTDKEAHTSISTLDMPNHDITLYAIYRKEGKTLTAKFNGNGVPFESTLTCEIKEVYNNEVQESGCTIVPPNITRNGFIVHGWNTDKDATSASEVGTNISLSENTTYYAITSKTVEITYEKGNNIESISKTSDTCHIYNSATQCEVTLPQIVPSDGYIALGWYNEEEKVGNADQKYNVSTDITLSSKAVHNEYTLTYNYNNATGGNTQANKTVTYNQAYGTLPTPTRAYTVSYNSNGGSTASSATATYTFNGWYKESAFTNQVTSSTIYNINSNSTIYAKWTSAQVTLPTPTKTGYTFAGWYSDSGLTQSVGAAGAKYTPTSNITLYAKWVDNIKPTVSLNPNTQTTYVKSKAVTVSLADAGSGLKASQKIYYAWSTSNTTAPSYSSYVTTTNSAGAKTASVTVPATSNSSLTGTYYLWIKVGTVADVIGNTSLVKTSAAFKFDNTPPTITASNNSSSNWTFNTVQITGTVKDAHSGVDANKIQYSYDKSTTYNDWTSKSTTSYLGNWSAPRNNQIFVRAGDNLGNYSNWISAGYVRIFSALKTGTEVWGSLVGPGYKFQTGTTIRETSKTASQVCHQWYCEAYVNNGDFGGTTVSTNWGKTFGMYGVGYYAQSGWQNFATYCQSYGTRTTNCDAYYTGGSGTRYFATSSASLTSSLTG